MWSRKCRTGYLLLIHFPLFLTFPFISFPICPLPFCTVARVLVLIASPHPARMYSRIACLGVGCNQLVPRSRVLSSLSKQDQVSVSCELLSSSRRSPSICPPAHPALGICRPSTSFLESFLSCRVWRRQLVGRLVAAGMSACTVRWSRRLGEVGG